MTEEDPRLMEDARAAMTAAVTDLAQAGPLEIERRALALRPQPTDYAQVFVPDAVDPLSAHFERLFSRNPVPMPQPGQTQVKLHVALAAYLRIDDVYSRPFPGGYRKLAPLLLPLVPWGVWRFHDGDVRNGMAYDGLVYLADEERVIWLPRPYRALRAVGAQP